MTQQQLLLTGVVLVALVLLIILIRRMTRRQKVTFDAIAPTPAPLARTAERATPPPAPTAPLIEGSPLTQLKGLGPKVATRLTELGVADVETLATLSDADVAAIDAQMGAFQGRLGKDRWVEQAQLLAAGDVAGFEAKFGKLGS